MTKIASTLHFVLVHGVGGGSWCWYKIRCLMENSGCKVSCIDLKSGGIDSHDPNKVLTFEDYNQPLIDFLSTIPDHHKIILVGHSAGGLSLTDAILRFGKKIHVAIFIAATMLRLGFWTEQDVKDGVPDLSEYGDVSDFNFGLGPDEPPTSVVINKEFQRKLLYQMSPLEDSTLASMLLKPGPIRALKGAQFKETGHDIDKVTRVYIKTLNDRILKPEQQDAMTKKWAPADVYVLDSDHSPMFSAPFLLFGMLIKAVAATQIKLDLLERPLSEHC